MKLEQAQQSAYAVYMIEKLAGREMLEEQIEHVKRQLGDRAFVLLYGKSDADPLIEPEELRLGPAIVRNLRGEFIHYAGAIIRAHTVDVMDGSILFALDDDTRRRGFHVEPPMDITLLAKDPTALEAKRGFVHVLDPKDFTPDYRMSGPDLGFEKPWRYISKVTVRSLGAVEVGWQDLRRDVVQADVPGRAFFEDRDKRDR